MLGLSAGDSACPVMPQTSHSADDRRKPETRISRTFASAKAQGPSASLLLPIPVPVYGDKLLPPGPSVKVHGDARNTGLRVAAERQRADQSESTSRDIIVPTAGFLSRLLQMVTGFSPGDLGLLRVRQDSERPADAEFMPPDVSQQAAQVGSRVSGCDGQIVEIAVVAPKGRPTLHVAYFFSGQNRKSSVGEIAEQWPRPRTWAASSTRWTF